MEKSEQVRRSEAFLALHHAPKLLVLPNIWDPLGALLLERLGYPAVATASAAVAYSHGCDDGERIDFATMLETIRRIAAAVAVPLTADIERGYADTAEGIAENVRQVLRAGAVGINIEDSRFEGGPLLPVEAQRERIRAVRRMADSEGVPLVINARTDVFLGGVDGSQEDKLTEAIARAKAYRDAGADCIYPIGLGELEPLRRMRAEVQAPLNVYASPSTAPMRELEAAGIARLSLGPGLIKASLAEMKRVALALRGYGSYDAFTAAMSSDEIAGYVSRGDREA